jgi:hypothetical protein
VSRPKARQEETKECYLPLKGSQRLTEWQTASGSTKEYSDRLHRRLPASHTRCSRERRDFRWLNEPLRLIGYIPPFGAFLRFREPGVGGIPLVALIPPGTCLGSGKATPASLQATCLITFSDHWRNLHTTLELSATPRNLSRDAGAYSSDSLFCDVLAD